MQADETILPSIDEEYHDDDPNTGLSLNEIIQKNVSKNIRSIRGFFSANSFITEKNNQKTNIINVGEKKTYCVPDTHIAEFFTSLDACRKENRELYYSERQETEDKQKSGIMIDFDRYQRAAKVEVTDAHFDQLVRHISRILYASLDYEALAVDDRFVFHIFFIRKPALVQSQTPSGPVFKDGFHILIPEIQVSKGFKKYLNQELISRDMIKTTFKNIDHIDAPEKMLDKMSSSAPVHFFGCSRPGRNVYELTHAYEVTFCPDDDINRVPLPVADLLADPDLNLTYELSLSFYMATIGGHATWLKKNQLDYRASLEGKIQLLVEKSSGDIIADDDILSAENSVDLLALNNAEACHLKKLLTILDISYATEYEKWFKVICAIAHTSVNYKVLAVWFSHRRPESWSPAEIDRVWAEATGSRFGRKPVTIRSVHHWARESSPQSYQEIEKDHYFNVLARRAYDNEGRVEHTAAAETCYAMVGNKFVVDVAINEKTGKMGYVFFEFVTPGQSMRKGEVYKWRKEHEPDNIHLFIGEHLPKVYAQLATNIKDRKDKSQNEGEMKYWANTEKTFRIYMSKLGNDMFQNGVVRQCQYKFRQRGFCEELDSYEDIIGVGNGVLKLGAEPVLIRGFHEYKISKFTEVDYVPYDPNNPCIQRLEKAFADMYPEEDVCNFMWYHACTGLDGKESDCILVFEVGGGRNGKTFKVKMIHTTLGQQYCSSGKSSLLTSKFERGEQANSAQMHMVGKHYFYFDEFEPGAILNTTRVKAMVTPGYQSGRDMYRGQVNFKNTCNPICMSNFEIGVETTDHGTWRRMKYYKNKVKFCENPNPENPFERPVDHRYLDEFPNDPAHQQAMLSILVHRRSMLDKLYGGSLKNVPTPTMDYETEIFRNKQDTLNRFLTEYLVRSPVAEAISLQTLATRYTAWYTATTKGGTPGDVQSQLENSRISEQLERRSTGGYFLLGHRLKSCPEEALQDGEEELRANLPTVIGVIPKVSPVSRPAEDREHFADDLTRNAPTHIQRSEQNLVNIDEPDINSIADLLGELL